MKIFSRLLFVFLCIFYCESIYADFFISEVLPNTTDDKNLEYIEIVYVGSGTGNLSGYTLSDKSKKSYTIADVELLSGERYRFLRSSTKLILNNSNEEVFLKDPAEEVVDSIAYTSSQKGTPLDFFTEEIAVISDESYLQVFFSDEATIQEKTPTLEKVIWSFQQPSYVLEKESISNQYYCDTQKEQCKINFSFLPSFPEGVSSSDYTCQTNFGFISGQENKCNPSTITFPTGTSTLQIQILEKNTGKLAVKDTIFIHNEKPEPPIEESIEDDEKEEDTEEEKTEENLPLPSVVYELQSPSYVETTQSGALLCDSSREVCKVNFDLRSSFSGELRESQYVCELDFGFETSESDKCNPNTIEIPLGEHTFVFRIADKHNPERYTQKTFQVINSGYIAPAKNKSGSSSRKVDIQKPHISLMQPNIEIQSGIDSFYRCTKTPCKINLKYEKNFSDERCLWNFGKGNYKQSTLKRCNPGYVEYPEGEHVVVLRVFQKNNPENFKETKIKFSYFPQQDVVNTDVSNVSIVSDSKILKIDDVDIVLQGRQAQHKTLSGSTLRCYDVESCSVNVTSQVSSSGSLDGVRYVWDLGNGEEFEGKNPPSKKYSPGFYTLHLRLFKEEEVLGEDSFRIMVQQKKKESSLVSESIQNHTFSGALSIWSIFPNPYGRDIKEWVEIKNVGTTSTSLHGCYLKRGSSKYKISQSDIVAHEGILRVYRTNSNISLPNSSGTLELFCNDVLHDSFSWKIKIPEGQVYFSDKSMILSQKYNPEYSREYLQDISFINLRILKSGVKVSGEGLPTSRVTLKSNQGHSLTMEIDERGIFEHTFFQGFSPGEIEFIGDFQDGDQNIYTVESTAKTLTQQDIWNFISSHTKKSRKKKPKKEVISSFLIPEKKHEEQEEVLSIWQHVGIIFSILFLVFIFGCYLLFVNIKEHIGSTTQVYMTYFSTKHRVTILLV